MKSVTRQHKNSIHPKNAVKFYRHCLPRWSQTLILRRTNDIENILPFSWTFLRALHKLAPCNYQAHVGRVHVPENGHPAHTVCVSLVVWGCDPCAGSVLNQVTLTNKESTCLEVNGRITFFGVLLWTTLTSVAPDARTHAHTHTHTHRKILGSTDERGRGGGEKFWINKPVYTGHVDDYVDHVGTQLICWHINLSQEQWVSK